MLCSSNITTVVMMPFDFGGSSGGSLPLHFTQSQPSVAMHQHHHYRPQLQTFAPHAVTTAPQPHVNLTYTSLLEVPYERFAEGSGAPVLVSNGTTASYVAPQHLLKTQAFQVALPVYSACPHYTQLGTCMLGASCGLVHTVQLVAPTPAFAAHGAPAQSAAETNPFTSLALRPHTSAPPPQPPLTAAPQPTSYSAASAAAYPMQHQMALPALAPLYAPSGIGMQTVPRDQLAGKALHRLSPVKKIKQRPLRFSSTKARRGNKPITVPAAAAGDTQPGPRQLIVNYLAPRVDTAGLRQLFEAFGEVEDALVVNDSRTGASRGFGFVVYKLSADAATAIDTASGRVLLGKRVRIGYLNPQFPIDASSRLSLTDIAATLEPLLNDDSDDTLEDSGEGAGDSASVTLTDDVSSDYFGFAAGRTSHQHSGSGAEM